MANNLNRVITGLLITISVIGIIYLAYSTFSNNPSKDQKNPYEYNIETFKKIDQDLIHYSEINQIDIDLNELYGIAIDTSDMIYVTGDNSLISLNQDGTRSSEIDLGQPAMSLAIGPHNEIYLGMKNHIQVYDNSGQKLHDWNNFEDNTLITSIAVTSENIFVADAANRVVLKLDANGNLRKKIGEKDEARDISGFIIPSPYFDVAIDPDGFLWVVNPGRHQLENYTSDGDLRSFWQKSSMRVDGFSGCCNPTHIEILSDGSFVTSEKGIVRIKVHNRVGEVVSIVASPDQFSEDTVGLDLAVDSKNQIYVLDPKIRAVRIYAKISEPSIS